MRLRVPIFILVVGILSGIVQLINNKYVFTKVESYIESIVFFSIITVIVFICERSGINERRVNIAFGLFILAAGVIVDLIAV
jgi:hypothetical protein